MLPMLSVLINTCFQFLILCIPVVLTGDAFSVFCFQVFVLTLFLCSYQSFLWCCFSIKCHFLFYVFSFFVVVSISDFIFVLVVHMSSFLTYLSFYVVVLSICRFIICSIRCRSWLFFTLVFSPLSFPLS